MVRAEIYRERSGKKKERDARRASSLQTRAIYDDVREVGVPPAIVDPKRRAAAKNNLRLHLETYHAAEFSLGWSKSHLLLIETLQQAVLEFLCQLIAFPRGSGKTSIARRMVEWATLHGHLKYPLLFAAEASKAQQHIDSIRNDLMNNDLLMEDFPEVCHFIRASEGVANRALYQTSRGLVTGLRWGASLIVFPNVEETRDRGNAGSVITTGTITGSAARGPLINNMRPDFALADDPQNRRSAGSRKQNRDRLDVINGDIMGMAGPGKKLSLVVTGTVIYKEDAIDQMLNRDKYPQMNGIRVRMIESMPVNEELWDQWWDIFKACTTSDRDTTRAHDFYREHQAELERGAKVYWEDRKFAGFNSALESAMMLYYSDPETFASEYQNEPLEHIQDDTKMPPIEKMLTHQSGFHQYIVPDYCDTVTAFIDVQKTCLYYGVYAWGDQFTCSVIDYGTFPRQNRHYFQLVNVNKTMVRKFPGSSFESACFKSLHALMDQLERGWTRLDGSVLPVSKGIVDANFGESTEVVYRVIHERGPQTPWIPGHGMGIRSSGRLIAEMGRKKGDQLGLHWRIPALDKRKRPVRHVVYDTNFWKTFLSERWNTEVPEPGHQTLYKGGKHRMYCEHLHAEYGMRVITEKRNAIEWQEKPSREDNHFLDCHTGAQVAASIAGIQMKAMKRVTQETRKRQKVTADTIAAMTTR